jgi:hypothetical protein
MSESLERCDHTDTIWLPCECDDFDEPHEFEVCCDCGEDVELI